MAIKDVTGEAQRHIIGPATALSVGPRVPAGLKLFLLTLAIVGLLTPARPIKGRPVLEQLEHRLHPWSSFRRVAVRRRPGLRLTTAFRRR